MHRIDGEYNLNNRFTDGDPLATPPVFPTYFTAKWCNAVQEEIANVIEKAGVTLDDTKEDQLLQVVNQSWVTFDLVSGAPVIPGIKDSQNVTSVTRISTGRFRINWDLDFDDSFYNIQVAVGWNDTTATLFFAIVTSITPGYCEIVLYDTTFALYEAVNMRLHVRASGKIPA